MENKKWFNMDVQEVEKTLKTNTENGLTQEQVKQNREQYGLNELQAAKKKTLL